jgi:uncharacterized protein YkwD
MERRTVLAGMGLALVAACARPGTVPVGSDGQPLPTAFRIEPGQEGAVTQRLLDATNSLRQAAGAGPLALDTQLSSAAATHSRDMAVQNRPWNFGSDGSSTLDRLARVGYRGGLVGEVVAETYETELQTLAAWMEEPITREQILNPAATRVGIAWYQEPSAKLWWTMVLAN